MKQYKTRKSNRLKEYDYTSDGCYFITICTKNRENIFGEISVGADGCRPDNTKMILNEYGSIVEEELKNTENIRNEIKLGQYIIMPNHLHCIIIIQRKLSGGQPAAPTGQTLSSFVSGFKSVVTKRINILRGMPGKPLWQRSFYDHIIRTTHSLKNIREYIINNSQTWDNDENNIVNYSIKGKACLAPTMTQ